MWVRLRFRTAKGNADRVFYIEDETKAETEMRKASSDPLFDHYELEIQVEESPIRYYFRVEAGEEHCYFNRLGATMDIQSCFDFCITPGFHTPEWVKGAVMYQIYVDRFCNGDRTMTCWIRIHLHRDAGPPGEGLGKPFRSPWTWAVFTAAT